MHLFQRYDVSRRYVLFDEGVKLLLDRPLSLVEENL